MVGIGLASPMNTIQELQEVIKNFAQLRDWDALQSPINLSMALSVEVAELMEHFQWLTESESCRLSQEKHLAVREEIADVFIYMLRLADILNRDLSQAAQDKIDINEAKYPVKKVYGSAKKFNK